MGLIIVKPNKTLPLSITGGKCSLQCDHCRGHFLKGMASIYNIEKIQNHYYKSVLISGGFDLNGKLPYIPKNLLENLKKRGFKLNYHLGLVEERDIKDVLGLVDEVSFDFILDEDIIENIFHLKKSSRDYKKTFELLREYFSVSPHIVLGLNNGKISKEYEAIEFLSKFELPKIIFIIFTPIKDTPMENISPPTIESLRKFFIFTKEKMPRVNLYLGCVRPKGDYRKNIDFLAYEIGFKAIVNPHPEVLEYLKKNNLVEDYFEECCAFLK
ncbi:MAG: radical SAM protein [Dictyoglomaceae bacterium]